MTGPLMDCASARLSLTPYLDGELAPADRAALEAHLADCRACQGELAAERALGAAVRGMAGHHRAPAGLGRGISAALGAASVQAPRLRQAQRMALAAAAVVLLSLGAAGGFFAAREPAGERLAAELTASHVRALMSGRLIDVASSDQHVVKPWFNGKLDLAPPVEDLSAQGFSLAGGRLDYVGGRPVAALVYRHRQHTINLYVWTARGAGANGGRTRVTRQGYNLVGWSARGMVFWAISDLNADDLERFAAIAEARFAAPAER